MSGITDIEWADKVWNPITGCISISNGCRRCYARRMAYRLRGRFGYPQDRPFQVTLHPDRLEEPLRWRKPARIFVCSMGDWMHDDVPVDFIDNMLEVMAACPQHTFLTLTKRPWNFESKIYGVSEDNPVRALGGGDYLPNLWLGVSVEDQDMADLRIPFLMGTLAAKRFVSYEPALGPVDFRRSVHYDIMKRQRKFGLSYAQAVRLFDWLIIGGETGPGARPLDPVLVRSAREQCEAAKIPFYFKSWGAWLPLVSADEADNYPKAQMLESGNGNRGVWLGGRKTGAILDGREWKEVPE